MKARTIHALVLALLLATAGGLYGCGGSDAAEASTEREGSAPAAETASNDGDAGNEPEKGTKKKTGKNGEAEEEKKEEAVPVEVAELERGAIESVLRFSSNLEAESRVKVFSQAKRLVTELLVEEGNRVRKGQVLLLLQDEEQRSAVAKVRSQLEKAKREFERQERLFGQELISEQAFNDAKYEMEQLQIALADAERELGYTRVQAPIGGTITVRMINLGDQVQVGQHLFDIVDFESIVARVFVPEKHLEQLRKGLDARITAQASAGREYDARVLRISPVVDPKSGTVKVTIDVGGRPGLRPGMYVDVDLVTDTNLEAVLVPKRALVYDDDQMFVYRLGDERRVERVFLEPRLTDKHFVEPVAGLAAGDRVVVAGQAGLKNGALVKLPGDPDDSTEPAGKEAELDVTRAGL